MTDIEYFYSTHSAYAYIGSKLLMEIVNRNECRIIHKPIDLNPVVEASSGQPFGHRSDAHRAYFFNREIERWAEHREASLINHRPTWHDEPLTLPNGFVIAAVENGHNADQLVHEILKAHWLDDANHNDPETLSAIAHSVGIDPAPLLKIAMSDEIQAIHQTNTEEAIRRSVFGSPTYFIDGDMFYGQDHLELVERALDKPYQGSWPK
ncbi:MAG: 2-hydroxychromene-2-carboxylate isomerase [Pseudomonadota bacterium]